MLSRSFGIIILSLSCRGWRIMWRKLILYIIGKYQLLMSKVQRCSSAKWWLSMDLRLLWNWVRMHTLIGLFNMNSLCWPVKVSRINPPIEHCLSVSVIKKFKKCLLNANPTSNQSNWSNNKCVIPQTGGVLSIIKFIDKAMSGIKYQIILSSFCNTFPQCANNCQSSNWVLTKLPCLRSLFLL